jgi:HAE1 family hydrophobic/amphiphilic exporter-1
MLKRIISSPIGACFIALSMALLGVMALHQLPVALLPPVELPVITVRCDKAGSSAIELEDQLLRPLEQALSTVPSLTSMEGLANTGSVEVRLSIRADADLEAITNRLRERLSGIPLPVGTDPPRVLAVRSEHRTAHAPDPRTCARWTQFDDPGCDRSR